MPFLDTINSPADLKALDAGKLPQLAEEIRRKIIDTVAVNGGHLASSLGAVELSIALHRVFATPTDKVIWDVGHQGYAHKLLTGRRERFETLRKAGGVSGFLRRDESTYDAFGGGHAGTSISAALGMAKARDILGEDFRVVAVIGDGSMTCGLPFEGLNNGGHTDTDLLVILNDNEMSIAGNVGALAKYLNRLVQSSFFNRSKQEARALIKRAPGGNRVIQLIRRFEETTKGLLLPSLLFEDLGFRYIGPVDGHDLDELIPTLERVRDMHGPVLLHAVTQKGRGYKMAESDAVFWHAPPIFEVETGVCLKSVKPTWTTVFGETLTTLAAEDKRIVAITAAMSTGTGLVDFSRRFPDRFFDVGIAEAHAVTSAAGMAAQGLRPVVAIYSSFMQRAFDSVVHDVALQNLPVIFAMDRAGLVGSDGPTHHGLLDVAFMRVVPNMVVMAPRDGNELRDMLLTAVRHDVGPVSLRYPRAAAAGFDPGRQPRELAIGCSEVIRHTTGPAVILSFGHVFGDVMEAVASLDAQGVEVGVVNARFAKPLDLEMLRDVARLYPVIISVEDGCAAGGFGSAVNEAFDVMDLDSRCHVLAVPDRNIEHGDQSVQREEAGISPARIAARVAELVARFEAKCPLVRDPKVGGSAQAATATHHLP